MTTTLIRQCAWCVKEGLVPPAEGNVTHGICPMHVRTAHIIPRLQGIAARLGGVGWLDTHERQQMAASLGRLITMLEQEGRS